MTGVLSRFIAEMMLSDGGSAKEDPQQRLKRLKRFQAQPSARLGEAPRQAPSRQAPSGRSRAT